MNMEVNSIVIRNFIQKTCIFENISMGFFSFITKEKYINRLVKSYKIVYECDDMTSIKNLRENYTKDELKSILETLEKSENRGSLDLTLLLKNPFKDE